MRSSPFAFGGCSITGPAGASVAQSRRAIEWRLDKETAVATVTVRVPQALLRRAQTATGERDADAAVRRALEIATQDYELNAASRRALLQSVREEREGKVRRFKTARDAVAHLKRL